MSTDYLFPNALPDETAFSLVCRFHLRAAFPNFQQYTLPLLNIKGARPNAEFPCFLPRLAELSGIDAKSLAETLTSIHYYEPFLTRGDYQSAVTALVDGNTHSLQSQLGAIANRISPGTFLKYCPECVKCDEDKYGIAYWHRVHQLVGVTACPVHQCHILEQRRSKYTIQLPVSNMHAEPGIPEECALSKLIAEELSDIATQLTKNDLIPLYIAELHNQGMLTTCGRIRQQMLHHLLTEKLSALSHHVLVFQFLSKQIQDGCYPACLFYKPNANHHPIKYLLLIFALFGGWSNFTKSINQEIKNEHAEEAVVTNKSQISRDWSKALALLKNGLSMRSVAATYSTTVSTLKIKAQQQGISVDVRPKKIFKTEERAIWRKLLMGQKTQVLATEFGVSTCAIEKILSKHPRLKALRERIWYFADAQRHQANILGFIATHKLATRNDIKRSCSASYTWLYKHENKWLYEHIPHEIPRSRRYLH